MHSPIEEAAFIKMPKGIEIKQHQPTRKRRCASFEAGDGPRGASTMLGMTSMHGYLWQESIAILRRELEMNASRDARDEPGWLSSRAFALVRHLSRIR